MITLKIPTTVNELDILLPAVTIDTTSGKEEVHRDGSSVYFKLELPKIGSSFRLFCPSTGNDEDTLSLLTKENGLLPFRDSGSIIANMYHYTEIMHVNYKCVYKLSGCVVTLPCATIAVHEDLDLGVYIITIDE